MEADDHSLIGLIPSAGAGMRMRPFRGEKELTVVGYRTCMKHGREITVPKVLGEYVMGNMLNAGARKLILITNEHKSELLKFYGDGSQYGASLAYVCQQSDSDLYGMPIALNLAYSWIRQSTVLLGMPDTIVQPEESFALLLKTHREKGADLTLGVYPTDTPSSLAPVDMDEKTGEVYRIFDKPKNPCLFNTWNIVIWGPAFTELLHDYVETYRTNRIGQGEAILSDVFNLAIDKGLRVYGRYFRTGFCCDLGDIEKFVFLKRKFEQEHEERKVRISDR